MSEESEREAYEQQRYEQFCYDKLREESELEAEQEEYARRLSRYDRAVELLRESNDALSNLHALVNGECPSLLEDDHHDIMALKAEERADAFLAEEPTR